VAVARPLSELEEHIQYLTHILPLTERILQELLRTPPPPTNLEKITGLLNSARQLEQRGEAAAVEQVRQQVEAGLQALRQWLAMADLGISPYVLRTYLERNPIAPAVQRALIRYFLDKTPHAESDRDKLDYLLTSYFAIVRDTGVEPRFASLAELADRVKSFFSRPVPALEPPAEIMLHELESLTSRVADFRDFDQLVQARIVERARALKINLGETFYHPRVLPTVISFNLTFRRHFEELFRCEVEEVKAQARAALAAARQIFHAIQSAFVALPVADVERVGAGIPVRPEVAAGEERLGRPLEIIDERPPMDRLIRRSLELQKENELRGIIKRIACHVEAISPAQVESGHIVFPLRHTKVELYPWEYAAFAPAAEGRAPISARTIQFSLGLVAWMEEELTLYQRNRSHRYLWKPHFDMLSYAAKRTHDQLKTIHELLRPEAEPEERAWFPGLVKTAQRLLHTLEKIAPVFA